MLATTVKLSSKGQVVIPKSVRESFHWKVGSELTLVATEHGVMLQTKAFDGNKKAAKPLRGFLQHKGEAVPTEELCKPVEYANDRV
jgi:AbrB family looped-hinge helix DNA binding protein